MKNTIAITCQNKKELSEHAGMCRNFFVYTVEGTKILSKELLELTKEESLHNAFHNPEMEGKSHPIFDVDILLVGGIGIRAINKLKTYGVATYIVQEKNPDIAVEKLLSGNLEAAQHPEGSCNCSGEGHNHQH